MQQPYRGYRGDEQRVAIPPGTSAQGALERLASAGVIRDPWLGRAWLQAQGNPPLQAGEYRFTGAMTLPEAVDKLVRGDVVLVAVTIVEGLTAEETAQALALAGLGAEERFLALVADPSPIADLDPEAEDLEGYLFPDSYRFGHGTTEERVVETLVETFRRLWTETVEDALPPGSAPSVREIVTLASIVEKEARLDEERPLVAAVYRNRLDRGIALYADPTIIYAKKRAGTWDGNLRRPDLALDSPYNTYVYPGLPPGPIASPGLASLLAAADPADVPYLYFVSRNDGTHVFSTTLAEHNRNVELWQRRYWRERWARERAERQAAGGARGASEGSSGSDGAAAQ